VNKSVKLLLLVFISIGMISCHKDGQIIYPEINIIEPVKSKSYDVFDTIRIIFRVEYPAPQVYLKINLQNENFTPVHSPLVIENFETGKDTELLYFLDNIHLETNTYYLAFQVSDQGQTTTEYRAVFIHEAPRQLQNVVLIMENNSQSIRMVLLNPQLNIQKEKIISGDYGSSDISSWHQFIFVSGKYSGDLVAYDADKLEQEWVVPIIQNPPHSYFTYLKYADNYLFTGFYNGATIGYNMTGQAGFSSMVTSGFYSKMIFFSNPYLISFSAQANGSGHFPGDRYAFPSGGLLSTFALYFDPVGCVSFEGGSLMIFGNDAQNHVDVAMLYPDDGFLGEPYQPFEMPGQTIYSIAEKGNGLIFLGLDSGIWLYNYQQTMGLHAELSMVSSLEYDEISSLLYAIDGNTLFVVDETGAVIARYQFENTIENVHLLYNK